MHAEPKPAPEEDTVPPGDDSNTDPTPPLPADSGRNGGERNPSAAAGQSRVDEEPRLTIGERDIPSDGRDLEGEAMIRDLGKPLERNSDK
ncbi:MAG: hypothetical protein H0W47_14985 [Polaromonas sp.]|uniref:hypothetical protein n=1 Tax=Polaromonas sp. TaxID=1869339 RepID=UPI0017CE8CBD|nr:hypothetical protein [Polaromonas sp.]MBA3595078.1 hypothetical protein [Polaromonas sp.]